MNLKFWKKKKNNPTPPQTRNRIGYWRKNSYPWYYIVVMEEICQIGDRSKINIIDFKVDLDCGKSIRDCKINFGYYDGHYIPTDNVNWETADQQYRRTRYISENHYDVDELAEEDAGVVHYVNDTHTNRRRLTPHNFLNLEEDQPICGWCHNSPCECQDVVVEGPAQDYHPF